MSATNEVTQAASLADAVLDAEAERQAAQEDREVLFADELLPGVGDEQLSLKEGLAMGGSFTFVMLLILNCVENFEGATLGVLAPDIRDSFGVSDGVIVFITAGIERVPGARARCRWGGWPTACRRPPIIAGATVLFGVSVFLSGLAINAFTLFLARFGVGMAKSATTTVHSSLIADTYPIGVRGRISAATMGSGLLIMAISPALVGGIAALAGGPDGWRWAFFLLGLPALAARAPRAADPGGPAGPVRDEGRARRGHRHPADPDLDGVGVRPPQAGQDGPHGAARASRPSASGCSPRRSSRACTSRSSSTSTRSSGACSGASAASSSSRSCPFAAKGYDARFRQDPAKALRLVGLLLLPIIIFVPIQYPMPNAISFAIVGVVPQVLLMTAFTMVGPILQSVVPYRLRGMGAALGVALHLLRRRHGRRVDLGLPRRHHRARRPRCCS